MIANAAKITSGVFVFLLLLWGVFLFLFVGVVEKSSLEKHAAKKVITVVYSSRKIDCILIRKDAKPWIQSGAKKIFSRVYVEEEMIDSSIGCSSDTINGE